MSRIHTSKRVAPVLALALAATGAAGALIGTAGAAATAGAGPTARFARVAKIQLRHTSLGKILVDSSGFTVYRFTKDTGDRNMCVKISECSGTWPAVGTSGKPVAGPGVNASLLSTIKLPNGSKQVTYAGHPLYRYSAATERAETSYAGAEQFGGRWYAVSAAGKFVK
jgi:predicted lipoprotein with Yx(FWY)xxD motif